MFNRLKPKYGIKALTDEEVKTYFEKFGTIVEINAKDNSGSMEFSNAVEAESALAQPIHSIRGCDVRVYACGALNLKK